MKYLLFSVLCLIMSPLFAQEDTINFPEDFFGSYRGDLVIQNARGSQTIGMEFHINETDSIGKYQYQIVYIADGKRQERNYNLITKNEEKGEYVVDENNGILLSAKQFENRLYSVFEVQGNLLTTIETFHEDHMIFEIIFSSKKEISASGDVNEDVPEVFSYPVTVSQRAKLIKQ